MNKSNLIGRAVKDPDVRYAGEKNTAIASLTLAVDRKFKQEGQPTADFINCKAFGKVAGLIEKYVLKGNRIGVTGHIQTGQYTNKDGNKVYTTDVIIDELDFLESKGSNSQNQQAGNGFVDIPDGIPEELPFN